MNALTSFNGEIGIKEFKERQTYINTTFSQIYLINLRRRPDRLISVLQKIRNLGIKVRVITAVDGNKNTYLDKYNEYLEHPIHSKESHPLERKKGCKIIKSPGAWGYLLTWKIMLQDARQNGYETILSLDDDVIFTKDFHQKFEKWIRAIPDNWKILQLGATQLPHLRGEINKKCGWFHPERTDGSFATAIHQSVYDDLLREIYKMNAPLDSGPLRAIYQKYSSNCYVAWPHLIIADVTSSDIRNGKNQNKIAQRLEWDLRQYDMTHDSRDLITIVLYVDDNTSLLLTGEIERFLKQDYTSIELIVILDFTKQQHKQKQRQIKSELDRIFAMHREKKRKSSKCSYNVICNERPIGYKNSIRAAITRVRGTIVIEERLRKGIVNILEKRLIQVHIIH